MINLSARIFALAREQSYLDRLRALALQVADAKGEADTRTSLQLSLPAGIAMAVATHASVKSVLAAIAEADWDPATAQAGLSDAVLTAALEERWPLFKSTVRLVEPFVPPVSPAPTL